MRLRKCLLVVVLIFMVVTFMRGNVSAYDMAEYFPLNQGDTWIYAGTTNHPLETIYLPYSEKRVINGTEVVNGVETTKKWLGPEIGNNYWCWAIDSEGVKKHKWYHEGFGYYIVYDPPEIYFPARLDVGETYQGSFAATVYSIDDDSILYTVTGNNSITLESVEDVTVIAGRFKDCLKFIFFEKWQTTDGSMARETEQTIWYARNVGLISGTSVGGTAGLICAKVNGVHYGCLATSALKGDTNALNTLRKFRDEVLSKTPEGQEIIRLYYQWSSVIVKAMEEDEEFKEEMKGLIDGVLGLIEETQ